MWQMLFANTYFTRKPWLTPAPYWVYSLWQTRNVRNGPDALSQRVISQVVKASGYEPRNLGTHSYTYFSAAKFCLSWMVKKRRRMFLDIARKAGELLQAISHCLSSNNTGRWDQNGVGWLDLCNQASILSPSTPYLFTHSMLHSTVLLSWV